MDELTVPETDLRAVCDECCEEIWVTSGHADHPRSSDDRCRASWRPVAVIWSGGLRVAVPIPGAEYPGDPDHPANRRLSDGSLLDIPF